MAADEAYWGALERPGECGDGKELRGLRDRRAASRLVHQLSQPHHTGKTPVLSDW